MADLRHVLVVVSHIVHDYQWRYVEIKMLKQLKPWQDKELYNKSYKDKSNSDLCQSYVLLPSAHSMTKHDTGMKILECSKRERTQTTSTTFLYRWGSPTPKRKVNSSSIYKWISDFLHLEITWPKKKKKDLYLLSSATIKEKTLCGPHSGKRSIDVVMFSFSCFFSPSCLPSFLLFFICSHVL